MGWKGLEWFDVAHDRYWWWDVVKAVMNCRVVSYMGSSVTVEELMLASQKVLFSIWFPNFASPFFVLEVRKGRYFTP